MSVRPPGYYTSWYHFVADLPTSTNVNLYDWIVANSYWNNKGKKLNAMITIPTTSIVSATDIGSIDANPAVTSLSPALLIDDRFRSYDRITLTVNGKIIGSKGNRTYSGTDDFTPPVNFTPTGFSLIVNHQVTSVTLQAQAGGGKGGDGTDNNAGAGGGGGGGGGYCSSDETVTPGTPVTKSGGGTGASASWSQGGQLITTSPGSAGSAGDGGGKRDHCNWFHCWQQNAGGTGGSGGGGGAGCTANGKSGSSGTGGSAGYGNGGSGGEGGAGGSGAGGKGGRGGDHGQSGSSGEEGFHAYSYKRRELYGPAINIKHTNVAVLDNTIGEILGGVGSIYGTKNITEQFIAGRIYGATNQNPY